MLKTKTTNLTENTIDIHKTKAIKTKNKISFNIDNENIKITIISPTKIILNRNTPSINSTLYFEENKITESLYNIKENNLTLYISLKTENIILEKNKIIINYTIIDSNTNYEYNIEMSEYK